MSSPELRAAQRILEAALADGRVKTHLRADPPNRRYRYTSAARARMEGRKGRAASPFSGRGLVKRRA